MGRWKIEGSIPIGEVTDEHVEAQIRAGALFIPTPEWIDPYAGISEAEKEQMVTEFEKPTPPVVAEIITD